LSFHLVFFYYKLINNLCEKNKRMNNYYTVKYFKIGKPNGTRTIHVRGVKTFEDLIYDVLLNRISNSLYDIDFSFLMDGHNIVVKRIKAVGVGCEYLIKCKDLMDTKHLTDYRVTIECDDYNSKINLFEQCYDETEYTAPKASIKKYTILAEGDSNHVRRFLFKLNQYKTLAKARKQIPKTTYYRNIKHCIEKGYVVKDKLSEEVSNYFKNEGIG
jgi:hypothetical protein